MEDQFKMAAPMESVFHKALNQILNSWTALQLAVQQEFGGVDSRAKAVWMVDATEQWFKENKNLDAWEVEEFLADILNNEFDTVVEDESARKTAAVICECYKLCQQGKHEDLAARLSKLPSCEVALQQSKVQNVEQESDSNDDEGEEESMQTGEASGSRAQQAGAALCGTGTQAPAAQPEMMNGDVSQEEKASADSQMEDDDGWTVVKHGKKR